MNGLCLPPCVPQGSRKFWGCDLVSHDGFVSLSEDNDVNEIKALGLTSALSTAPIPKRHVQS